MITKLVDSNGQTVEDIEGIQHLMSNHFQQIFTSGLPTDDELERGTETVFTKVDAGMNATLLQSYTEEEIQQALFQMAPLKSPGLDEDAVVAALIDPTTDDWDPDIVDAIFYPEDRDLILKLPIGRSHQPDVVCWHFSATGTFTVRNAYFLGLKIHNRASSSLAYSSDPVSSWKLIWKANVPPKVSLFAWRLANTALPTSATLERRMKILQPLCSYCGVGPECLSHVFLQCHVARQAWALSNLPWNIISCWNDDPLRWINYVGLHLQVEKFDFFLVICWFLWWSRNEHCMEKRFIHPMQTVTSARCFIEAYREASLRSPGRASAPTNLAWHRPPNGFIKINFDGALFHNGTEIGVRVVAQDCQGDVRA
ncbi:UNVERIFIED_CONTAM: hypothetical protein Slati_0139700 [Sesamum latifolium]|uniref:Reverse transcriptase zinc-binding domain-containing protein n=1 Tax=Sesamum latifolium TaxID=2727402 RepID=A0AAW2Y9I6_9LAMI